ncbi:transcription factor MYB16-like [Durio zibethinus]|uniref:Transcription factor MYB16-like n=1 Tax=Durio zibethinus TaxID=66656 RepID=A0A6P6ALV4_DURZI|nr:transcription factor MYB16-like [Durio zibethinus]
MGRFSDCKKELTCQREQTMRSRIIGTHISRKKLIKIGIDPMTHKRQTDASRFPSGLGKNASNLSHMAQWESARIEAEVRLVYESKQVEPNPNAIRPKNQITSTSSQQIRPRYLEVLKAWQSVAAGMFTFTNQVPNLNS